MLNLYEKIPSKFYLVDSQHTQAVLFEVLHSAGIELIKEENNNNLDTATHYLISRFGRNCTIRYLIDYEACAGTYQVLTIDELQDIISNPVKDDDDKKLTGGSANYYKVYCEKPYTLPKPYHIECGDIINALEMNYAEGNVQKSLFRVCQNRRGKGKEGTTSLYDAEKMVFFSVDILKQQMENYSKENLKNKLLKMLELLETGE